MQKKIVKISLFVLVLSLSIIFPVIIVSAKKKPYTTGPILINNTPGSGYTWEDWSDEPWLKGSGTQEDPYMIMDLNIEVSGFFAMMIQNSNAHFKIMKCRFRNTGIPQERTAGLILAGVQNGVVFKNTFTGNLAGLALMGAQNNLVHMNVFTENEVGVFLQWSMFNKIKKNEFMNNFGSGIMISSAHKTIIEKNELSGNSLAGIFLVNEQVDDLVGEHDPKDNIIYKNAIEDNKFGILFQRADINDVIYNTFSGNEYGVLLNSDCEGNSIYHNNFLDNGVQAFDAQPVMNNFYHPYMLEGNFWLEYEGVDENEDGIGDIPYGYDVYPLMEKNGWEFQTAEEQEIVDAFYNNINRLGSNRYVYNDQTSYIIYGVIQLFSERINGEAYPPYTAIYAGIEAVDSVWIFVEESNFGEPGLMQLLYIKIPPYYMTEVLNLPLGYNEFEVYISWYNSGIQNYVKFITGFYLI